MTDKKFPDSELPIRQSSNLLPKVFQTPANEKFMEAVVDPLIQPGVLQKVVGYIGRRHGKTYRGSDIYLDTDNTLRSRYQLEPGVVVKDNGNVTSFHDYLDFKNQLKFFGNNQDRDFLITNQEHYSWNPPIDWDKFVNYREYYWVPSGPPPVTILGNRPTVTSTYTVVLGTNSFVFRPDGYTNNPTLTLYRGQTYKFKVNAPGQGFVIRTNYDTASLTYNSNKAYELNDLVVYDNKLWRAIAEVNPNNFPSESSPFWKYVDSASAASSLDYNTGVKNNGTQNGTITFQVPYDAPDVLYYQSRVDVNLFGKFIIGNIEEHTKIDVNKEIVGKEQYTSSNGVELSNGMIIQFAGRVAPAEFSKGVWLVEGVGEAIKLINFANLEVPAVINNAPEVIFDNSGFDTEPFDDATNYPGIKDYITISRATIDANPWSRYNRWFHKSVLDFAYRFRGEEFPATETDRAKRPIIEFLPNLQLFNHGSVSKAAVDYVETFTKDIFSEIEGSEGFIVDGESLTDGARLLVVSDTDSLVNNKIFVVTFITHNGRRQIALREATDAISNVGECVLVRRGRDNAGLMYHFTGETWIKSQQKTKVNQPPLFDAFDENGVSFSDDFSYPINNFKGTKILSYKEGNGVTDSELGISLSYLNIDNVGDIVFDWNWGTDSFIFTSNDILTTQQVSEGYYKFNPNDNYNNGWIVTDNTYIQPLIDSVTVTQDSTNQIELTSIVWDDAPDAIINFYLNGVRIKDAYTRDRDVFTFSTRTFIKNDVISVKIITTVEPRTAYYEIPVGLEKNPLNQTVATFTLGQAADHVSSAVEFNKAFVGAVPGANNLRDLPIEYRKHAKRFMKHSSSAPLAISLLCDKTNNIVNALQYAKRFYTNFKNNFLSRAAEIEYVDNIPDFVDAILADITKTKTQDSPFFDSGMVGTGAFTSIDYEVEDTGIRTFALSERFSLREQSRRAVYVYVNNQQLLNDKDYTFNENFGFVTISADISVGDKIQIREYVSTAACFIPPTPTKLGLYKKFTPVKFRDDTYQEPRDVIRCHDGSIIFAYGDFRDDLILEVEYRIYNNIRQEYDTSVFDIDTILGGYYGGAEFTKEQLDAIVNQEFLKWIQNTDINYTENSYFRETESFTYTYSNMTDPSGTQNLPGWWRGVYQWFYDTDQPHRAPWEMLGFSQQPLWWESEYGPAPYTSNNLILWEDLAGGVIRRGTRAGTHDRYKRPTLMNHIPVDGDGKLLSPLDSGLAGNFVLINNKGNFKFGDVSPVEHAWRNSSEWPFSVIIALCLLKPFEFISTNFDRTKVTANKLGQIVNISTNKFITLDQFTIPNIDQPPCAGLINYLVDYAKSKKISTSIIDSSIRGIDVVLSSRLSGFVDKNQQRYLLDSKNPRSSSGSVYVPVENYDIIFNVSSPIGSIAYSGVILEKTDGGWYVSGYDKLYPYFNYYAAIASQRDPVITVGGVSETYVGWVSGTTYSNGQVVLYRNNYYRALKTHIASDSFESSNWKQLPDLPIVNGTTALRRRNFNKTVLRKLSYGTKLTSIQEVVDFLLGYEQYLLSLGLKFDRYDKENQVGQNWLTSCKEFMFWTKHNWAIKSLIALSPAASAIDLTIPIGVADNLLDSFYDYQIFKSDGTILEPKYINVSRKFQNITVETTNTTDGIYFIRMHFVLKEHVVVFDDRTVFNDVIYDKPTGYRQERIKTQGFRTVDWDGDYTSPGFLFDNVNISQWQPFTDYKLGDIVSFQSKYWTSQENQLASETFDDTKWSVLDSTPEKQLVANFDYKINLFDDYYNAASEGIGQSQRELARHAIGYQERQYLQDLAEDPVTQFQLYQGFIREKGTANSVTKIFDKLSRSGNNSIELNEEWAFRVGRFGGIDQIKEVEFYLYKDNFVTDPQPIIISDNYVPFSDDQYYHIPKSDFTITSGLPVDFISSTVRSIALYDTIKNEKIRDIDVIAPATFKVLNAAEQELTFKTLYDPAVYSVYISADQIEVGKTYEIKTLGTTDWNLIAGTDAITYAVGDVITAIEAGSGTGTAVLEGTTVDTEVAWTSQYVGKLWWDLSTAKWMSVDSTDSTYSLGNWNTLAEGASIDVYEWVETVLLPSEWSALADTNEGLAENISGQPLYPNDNVYSVKVLYNEYSGLPTGTLYYYWVKNTVVLPANDVNRRISASEVASLIRNPQGSAEPFISFIAPEQFLTYNFSSFVTKTGTVINIESYVETSDVNPIHTEYQLLTEGVEDSLPAENLETKWIDSLIGYDNSGIAIPDINLPAKQRYGISFRPRQSMFINRLEALKVTIEYVNSVLAKDVFADFVDRSNLELVDRAPDSILNLYDTVVETELDLNSLITSRLKQAKIALTIIDGEIDSVQIIEPGFGYKVTPPVVIDGNGVGARVNLTIDLKGRVVGANIVSKGKRYTVATAEVRPFSVLVTTDSKNDNFWGIYGWDDVRKVFYRSQSQAYDTTRYWTTTDWWKSDYSIGSRIVKEIVTLDQELTINVRDGDLIRVKEYGSGGWAVFKKVALTGSFLDRYSMVGRESGTFQLKSTIYDLTSIGAGYDNNRSFDIGEYDVQNFRELRNIFKAIKEDIFIGDYSVEWNKLFFIGIRYVFSEQQYVDWAFKTSFLSAIHNVGSLEQKLNYRSDNLESFQEYIDEVKPYRTTVREYVSRYDNLESLSTGVTDFDLPARYSTVDGKVVSVTELDETINEYPWKSWLDNKGFSIVAIEISDHGNDYVQPPSVVITGNGSGATARAYISNGKVSAILITNPGYGYTQTPTVSLVGGNGESLNNAKAIAILGDTKVRSFKIGMKYDRITKTGQYLNFVQEEPLITANGYTAAFELTYPITRDKTKIHITINNNVILDDQYTVTLYTVTSDTYQYQKGKIIFKETPAAGDVIAISYEKDDAILDSVNRINKFYDPTSGMRGKDIPQLMTGIDFGGVQIQGSSFGITGGWDSLPWYTDYWDSVDPSGDFYYVFAAPDYEELKIYTEGAEVSYARKIYELSGVLTSQGISPGEDSNRWKVKTLDSVVLPYIPAKDQRINIYRKLSSTVDIQTNSSMIDYSETDTYNLHDVIRYKQNYYSCTSREPIVGVNPDEALGLWKRIPETYRVDDPAWDAEDSTALTNANALMPTFVGNGVDNVIDLSSYFDVIPHETLIFRLEESDGSTNIVNSSVLDTRLSGGSLADIGSSYSTVTGFTADEIVIDGTGFVSPDYVPAPEENIPGQVLDSVSITVFQKHLDDPTQVSAFNIHKDMLNMHYYKRYSAGTYVLAKDFYYYDTSMVLNTTENISTPVAQTNIPGTIMIGGERIEFLTINGNKLGQLRRGTFGTSIREMYPAGTPVIDIGYNHSIPYADTQTRFDAFYNTELLTYDGSSNSFAVSSPVYVGATFVQVDGVETLVANKENIVITITNAATGTVKTLTTDQYEASVENDNDYVITIIDSSIEIQTTDLIVVHPLLIPVTGYTPAVDPTTVVGNTWYRKTIPTEFGQCNEIEVFVGGSRIRKSPVSIYDENLGVASPAADRKVEAEFSVDGVNQYIRLTTPPSYAGIKITVIKRSGNIWYDRGETTASKGINLLENNTLPAKFIAQKTTDIPE